MVENGAFCHKIDYVNLSHEGHPNRIYWFKSYNNFAELVDFAFGGASAMEGLRLQPAQQACLMYHCPPIAGRSS